MSYNPSVQQSADANDSQLDSPEATKRLVRVDGLVGLIFLIAIAFFAYWFAGSVRTKFMDDHVTQREPYQERNWIGYQQEAR